MNLFTSVASVPQHTQTNIFWMVLKELERPRGWGSRKDSCGFDCNFISIVSTVH